MRLNYAITLLFTLILLNFSALNAQVSVPDSLALVDLYKSTNGSNWSSTWVLKKPVALWPDITLNEEKPARVIQIALDKKNLNGTLPVSLANLTALEYLSLNSNPISGNIPPELGNLKNLKVLRLSATHLSGNIPAKLGNLTNLVILELAGNQLSGSIPPELSKLKNLGSLNLYKNKLTGSIPAELGNITQLNYLLLDENELSGNIPPELGKLTQLASLWLQKNHLTGRIPPELGNINSGYQSIDLSYNQLTGSIPPELGKFTNLNSLQLNNNQLSGAIPAQLSTIRGSFFTLNLSYNNLSGKIPSALGNLTEAGFLFLNNNKLSGAIPVTFGKLIDLRQLDLSNNQLSGNIPAELGNLFIYNLNLNNNLLTGNIPPALGNILSLSDLNLSQNEIKGNIPASFSKLTQLETLQVGYNKLEGIVPSFLGDLPALKTLGILKNHYTFDGIETLVKENFADFKYGLQEIIAIHQKNNKLSVHAGGTIKNNTYTWFKNNKQIAVKNGDSTFEPSSGGVYSVKVTNSIATKLTLYSDTITFNKPVSVSDKNNIALAQTDKSSFSIYPNPARSIVTVEFTANGTCTLLLTDISGKTLQQKVITSNIGGNKVQFNINDYASGIYFITLRNEERDENNSAKKTIKVYFKDLLKREMLLYLHSRK